MHIVVDVQNPTVDALLNSFGLLVPSLGEVGPEGVPALRASAKRRQLAYECVLR